MFSQAAVFAGASAPVLLCGSQILAAIVVIALCFARCIWNRFCSVTADPLQAALNEAISKDGPSASLLCRGGNVAYVDCATNSNCHSQVWMRPGDAMAILIRRAEPQG